MKAKCTAHMRFGEHIVRCMREQHNDDEHRWDAYVAFVPVDPHPMTRLDTTSAKNDAGEE